MLPFDYAVCPCAISQCRGVPVQVYEQGFTDMIADLDKWDIL